MTAAPEDPPPELQVCALVREAVGWDRLVVVVARDVDTRAALRGSDAVLEGYCDLQQTLLQGPSLDAFTWGAPVVVDDLRARLPWPLLSSATPPDLPVRSVAVLPLLVPAGTPTDPADPPVQPDPSDPPGPALGVLTAGRDRVDPFTRAQVSVLTHLAAVVSALLVHRAATGELVAVDVAPNDDLAVAAGMLAEHLGATAGEAKSRLRAHAFTSGRTLNGLARAVLDGEVAVGDVAHPR